MKLKQCFLLIFLVTSFGCASSSKSPMEDPTAINTDFDQEQKTVVVEDIAQLNAQAKTTRILPGDLIELHQPDDPKVNGRFRVDYDGTLALPYKIAVKAKGFSLSELRKKIHDAYAIYFKQDSIRADLVERRYWLEVRGLVTKPGRYLVERKTNIDEIIKLAGGFPQEKKPEYVQIQQGAKNSFFSLSEYYRSGDQNLFPAWDGGDTVFFLEEGSPSVEALALSKFIRIVGEIKKPGEVPYKPGADFTYYLAKAGGPTQFADLKNIQLIRGEGRDKKTYEFRFDDPNGIASIENGDFIFVPADRPGKTEKAVSTVGGAAAIVSAIALLIMVL